MSEPITFAVISDTHFYAPGARTADKYYWNRVLEPESGAIGQALVETIKKHRPDFVIHCGDITGHCDLENWETACQTMDQFGCPWYGVLGNHDTWFPGVRDAFRERYSLPAGQYNYSRTIGGLNFIFLDLANWIDTDGRITPYLDIDLYDQGKIVSMGPAREGIEWLEKELDMHPALPTVLVSHPPIAYKASYQVSTLPKGKKAPDSSVDLSTLILQSGHRDKLLEIICRHPQVTLALAGHWHLNDVTHWKRARFVQTASLREYPFEIRLFELDNGRLAGKTTGLSETRFREESFVPEWNNDWIAGKTADREIEIDLTRYLSGRVP